jgi:hypothetical protein
MTAREGEVSSPSLAVLDPARSTDDYNRLKPKLWYSAIPSIEATVTMLALKEETKNRGSTE